MFQFPRLAAHSLCIQLRDDRLSLPGCPIRRSTDQRLLAPPRGFSQLSTSFIASRRLGIHRAPLVAFPFPKARIDDSRPGFVARDLQRLASTADPLICGIYKTVHVERDAVFSRSPIQLSENEQIERCSVSLLIGDSSEHRWS